MDCTIEAQLKLILGITPLGWGHGRFQHAIQPGRIGVLNIGGRIHDRHKRPLVFYPGDRPAYRFLASRLYGIPGLGRVEQHVIEFAQNPGTIAVTIRQSLLGLSKSSSDPASVTVQANFKLIDPVTLLDKLPDWDRPQGLAQADQRLTNLVKGAAEVAISNKLQDISANPGYLMATDLNLIQTEFRMWLQVALDGWGLRLVEGFPPTRQYPEQLAKVLYAIHLGAAEFQIGLERERQELGQRMYKAQTLERLSPAAGFIDMVSNQPEVAIKLIEAAGQQTAEATKILQTVLLTQDIDAEVSKQIILNALRQQEQAAPYAGFGSGGSGSGGAATLIDSHDA